MKYLTIAELMNSFENGTLDKKYWNHNNKLRICCFYLIHETNMYQVINNIRCSFIRYNKAVETENLCSQKYNETITFFWLNQCIFFLNMSHVDLFQGSQKSRASLLTLDEVFFDMHHEGITNTKFALHPTQIFKKYNQEYLDSDKAKACSDIIF